MSIVRIYILKCPDTLAPRYVGKTTGSLGTRLSRHLIDRHPCHRTRWVQKLKREGKRPVIELVEEVAEDEWQSRERYWIARLLKQGCDLVNATGGGEGQARRPDAGPPGVTVNYRLFPKTLDRIERLAEELHIKKAEVVEMAVRVLAKREKVE